MTKRSLELVFLYLRNILVQIQLLISTLALKTNKYQVALYKLQRPHLKRMIALLSSNKRPLFLEQQNKRKLEKKELTKLRTS